MNKIHIIYDNLQLKQSAADVQSEHNSMTMNSQKKNQLSCVTNGFAMASMPSAGHISTTDVPLHTTSPSCRVSSVSLYGSSGSTTNANSTLWLSTNAGFKPKLTEA